MIVDSVQQLIGNTPLFRFSQANFPQMAADVEIYAKLEYLNPGGSIKDRFGDYLFAQLKSAGMIGPETVIIEPTAGNTGIGFALAALRYHLRTIFVVPEKFSLEKQALMAALGGEIVHTKTSSGITGAIEKARQLAAEIPDSVLPLQFENPLNPAAYAATLGPELLAELPQIDSFVAGIGSGGTFAGVGHYLQEHLPKIRLVGVEPEGSILNGETSHSHEIEGIGVEFVPKFLQAVQINRYETISDQAGFQMTRHLAKEYGLLVGSSSGAAMVAALREAAALPAGSQIVTIFPDAGDRYLSKDIYSRKEYQ